MRVALCLALMTASLACSGGRDPVRTISGNGENAGPGTTNPPDGDNGIPIPTTMSTLVALCIQACAHIRAEGCEGAPAHTTDACESDCKVEALTIPPPCADESAALYSCTRGAKITCPGNFSDIPEISGCDSESTDLQECLVPGSDCALASQNEPFCLDMGLSELIVCSEGIQAPPPCIQVASDLFCCP